MLAAVVVVAGAEEVEEATAEVVEVGVVPATVKLEMMGKTPVPSPTVEAAKHSLRRDAARDLLEFGEVT